MDLTPYVDSLRHELGVAAEAGGEEARLLAERLTGPLESAIRLTLLGALSDAMNEVTRDLAPGSVDVRLRGLDPEFVVTPPPAADSFAEADPAPARTPAPAPVEAEEGTPTRISFRPPAQLKLRVEEAASREGLSINAWLVRAVATALESTTERGRSGTASTKSTTAGQGFTGWVR
ncbi:MULTISPECIES: hypothetical protein [unclassified Streptomyces]|uniref:hypothetical protein n=1 Tax=unclassified Streptomyces TaxID=2593676 RepID=UPI0016615CFA|nr:MULTISPECIES: hypothetical protein [unclassified Streptomyces]MBD0709457.1 hypothetical protein [Streptomyces sp. CBMA291]MBD0713167.1 hypothetical protein [Streptomyces sp. CBMA370]